MKYLACFFLFCLTTFFSHAQPLPLNALQSGIGLSAYNREGVRTASLLVAYKKSFIPSTVVEVSGEHAFPVDYQLESETGKIQSLRFGLSLLYNVVEERSQYVHVGFGFSAGLYHLDYIEVTGTVSSSAQITEMNPGFLIISEYHYVLPNNLFFGARANVFRYDEEQRGWNIGLVGGLRF